jgi:hypothetical protein
MSDTGQENEYKLVKYGFTFDGFAIMSVDKVFAFIPSGMVSDYIKSKKFELLEDFIRNNFIKIDGKNKYLVLSDGKTKFNFNLIEKVLNFIIKVMGYDDRDIYVYFEFEKPLVLKITCDFCDEFYFAMAPIIE